MRRGDGRAVLEAIELLGERGQPSTVWRSGEPVTIAVAVRFTASVADPVVGIMIRSRVGLNVYGTNTELEHVKLGPVAAGETRRVTYRFNCDLCPGLYTVTAASHDPDGIWHDWLGRHSGFFRYRLALHGGSGKSARRGGHYTVRPGSAHAESFDADPFAVRPLN